MNAILKPIALGVGTYLITGVGLWFVLSFVLMPFMSEVFWVLPGAVTIVPLFVSGYVAARYTGSSHRFRRTLLGIIAGMIGFALSLVITSAGGLPWFLGLLFLGAAAVAATGAALGARAKCAL